MAIPKQFSTSELDVVELKLQAEDEKIFSYPSPTDEQYLLIGKYIHCYNYIDLNARRCVETFAYAKMIVPPPKKGHLKIHPSEILPIITKIVEKMPENVEPVQNTQQGLAAIEKYRDWRNVLAHFGARRIPSTDILLFVSKDNLDFKQAHQVNQPEQHMMRAIVPYKNLKGLLKHIVHCDDWFAHKTSEWIERYHPKSA